MNDLGARGGRRASTSSPAAAAQTDIRLTNTEPLTVALLWRIDLVVILVVLFGCLLWFDEPLTIEYGALAIVALIVAGRCISAPDIRQLLTFGRQPTIATSRLLFEWATVVGVLLFAGFALKISETFSRRVLLTWFAATPLALIAAQALQSYAARWLGERSAFAPRYVIVGANNVGVNLASRLSPRTFMGYFDFRSPARAAELVRDARFAGHCRDIGAFVKREGVEAVYVALPISNSPRIKALLDDLRDTTASVYFVPDVFAFDLIQARVIDLNGMPALAICDTPLHGLNAVAKRASDVVIATIALALLWPLLLLIAVAVKWTSPGPALFRQLRYGLNGETIQVLKFRTMSVCEDGPVVRQASRGDRRLTPIGRLLRRTSLDELPQLINVLTGSMSLVGPRPHAVAHNELYRKVISGYMLRHKVRPGITGLAQVEGFRGETETLDKMERRVHFDLEYLNNWSLALDMKILLRTVAVVLRDPNAF